MIKFFEPSKTYQTHKEEFDAEIQRVLNAGDLILRSDVERFEKNVADYIGTKYAVALNSCTDALYLALRGLKIGQGDEVLVPSRTFVASVQVIKQVGATPVYYDLEGVLNFTDKTKAIIPVHIEGAFDSHFDRILDLAREKGWYVIEDAAQAFGAVKNGKKAGSFGIAGCFSFYPAKTLGAFGDAGALTTNDKKLYNWVKGARNHFKETAEDWGVNSRLDNLQAAILNVKFKYYENALKRRQEIAEMYHQELKGVELPRKIEGRIWQDYIIRVGDDTHKDFPYGLYGNKIYRTKNGLPTMLGGDAISERDELYEFLKENGIETMKNNYPFPVPKLPQSQKYEDETLRLPCNENLTNEEVQFIIKKIKQFYE